jgi:hypothetical protein
VQAGGAASMARTARSASAARSTSSSPSPRELRGPPRARRLPESREVHLELAVVPRGPPRARRLQRGPLPLLAPSAPARRAARRRDAGSIRAQGWGREVAGAGRRNESRAAVSRLGSSAGPPLPAGHEICGR